MTNSMKSNEVELRGITSWIYCTLLLTGASSRALNNKNLHIGNSFYISLHPSIAFITAQLMLREHLNPTSLHQYVSRNCAWYNAGVRPRFQRVHLVGAADAACINSGQSARRMQQLRFFICTCIHACIWLHSSWTNVCDALCIKSAFTVALFRRCGAFVCNCLAYVASKHTSNAQATDSFVRSLAHHCAGKWKYKRRRGRKYCRQLYFVCSPAVWIDAGLQCDLLANWIDSVNAGLQF